MTRTEQLTADVAAELATLKATLARVSEERDELLAACGGLLRWIPKLQSAVQHALLNNPAVVAALLPPGAYGEVAIAEADAQRAIARARQSPPSTVGQPGDGAAGRAGEGVG